MSIQHAINIMKIISYDDNTIKNALTNSNGPEKYKVNFKPRNYFIDVII